MLGKTHVSVGITTALLATCPSSVSGVIGAVAGGAIGGWICDIDVRESPEEEGGISGFIIMAVVVGLAMGTDYLLGNGICEYMVQSWTLYKLLAAFGFVAGCFYGVSSSHRTFMHSLVGWVFFSLLVYVVCKPLMCPFAVGYMMHLLLDLLNKRGLQLFFPLNTRISLGVCSSDGQVNRIVGGIAIFSSVILIVFFGTMALRSEKAVQNLVAIGSKEALTIKMSYLDTYLIVINVISFIAYVVDYMLCYNNIIGEENEETFHEFLNIFAYIGGAVGALIALILFTKKGRANAYWFVKIISLLIAWTIIYMIVMDPFEFTGKGVKRNVLEHLPMGIYLIIINVISVIMFINDRFKRRSDLNLSEVLLLLIGLIGGAAGGYFVMILTNGKRKMPHFALGFPVMIALHTLIIIYLVYNGIA